jgi:hypothetical protein
MLPDGSGEVAEFIPVAFTKTFSQHAALSL